MCEWSPMCANAAVLKPAVATAARETSVIGRRMVFLMAERGRYADLQFYAHRRPVFNPAFSIDVDEHRAAFDRGGIGLHRDHAGRRHYLAGLDVELAVVEVAFDHVTDDAC